MASYYSQTREFKDSRFRLKLREAINKHYNLDELRLLAAELSVDWDSIPGQTKQIKLLELVEYLDRRKELGKLISVIKRERPNVDWPGFPAGTRIDIRFDYFAFGKTEDGIELASEGRGGQVDDLDADYFDDGIAFAAAMEFIAHHFYTFEAEKEGYFNISAMTISITNMQCTVIPPENGHSDNE